jgi:hypothetical protein
MDALMAYLDPGSGSMILQAVLGGVAGVVVALKMFGRRVFSFLTFWKRDDAAAPAAESKTDS